MGGDAIADLAKVKAEKVALKLSAKEIETLTLESLKIALDKKATSALIKQLATAKKDIKDAKATIDMVQAGSELVFKLQDASNNYHPFYLSTTPDGVHGGGTEYMQGVMKSPAAS